MAACEGAGLTRTNSGLTVSSSILTHRQAVALSDRQYAAAVHLLDGKFYAQAVARGYYSLYTLVNFVVRRRPDWPGPTWRDGSPRPDIQHEDMPGYVQRALQSTTGHSLVPRDGRIDATELLAQRIAADYLGYQEITEELAHRLLQNCLALRGVLLSTAHQHQNDPIRSD